MSDLNPTPVKGVPYIKRLQNERAQLQEQLALLRNELHDCQKSSLGPTRNAAILNLINVMQPARRLGQLPHVVERAYDHLLNSLGDG